MAQAYFNEPTPLKQQYPEEQNGMSWIQIIAALCAAIAISMLTTIGAWPGSWWLFLLIVLVPSALSALLFWIAPSTTQKSFNKAWKKAFKANNEDLHLDYTAIDQVIEYLNKHTTYLIADFEHVAVSLAIHLRQNDPFDTKEHSNCSREVLHAYFHLKDGSKPFVISSCPREDAQ